VSWQRVKGHDGLIAAFERAALRGRLAHAYLFTGPQGIGKRRFANELAKTLLCESPPEGRFDACDRCAACGLVDAGTHPDCFAVARPEDRLELPIEVVRRLCADMALKPARGGRKIAILDDADDLNEESANCFLKTLEEPPPLSLLILIGTSPDRQLGTIRSRCQVIPFTPLPPGLVCELLRSDDDVDPARAEQLAKLGEGSPGLTRELADPALWAYRRKLLEALAKPNPDTPGLAREWLALVEDAGKESGAQRRRAALVLRLIVDGFRQALARGVGRTDGPGLDLSEAEVLDELARHYGPDGLVRRLERCLEADAQIDRRLQLVLVLEALVDTLAFG
jgi:DNA polymerase-3 subunit delta'